MKHEPIASAEPLYIPAIYIEIPQDAHHGKEYGSPIAPQSNYDRYDSNLDNEIHYQPEKVG